MVNVFCNVKNNFYICSVKFDLYKKIINNLILKEYEN